MKREYRELVIDITPLKAKFISKLLKGLEKEKAECYFQDEKGNTFPALRSDMERIFGKVEK